MLEIGEETGFAEFAWRAVGSVWLLETDVDDAGPPTLFLGEALSGITFGVNR